MRKVLGLRESDKAFSHTRLASENQKLAFQCLRKPTLCSETVRSWGLLAGFPAHEPTCTQGLAINLTTRLWRR